MNKKLLLLVGLFSLVGCGGGAGEPGKTAGTVCAADVGCLSPLTCYNGTCVNTCQDDSECAKTHRCTEKHICEAVAGPACQSDADCTDPAICQAKEQAYCQGGSCHYLFEAAGTPCDDGNVCTKNEVCDGLGQCKGGQKVVCNEPPAGYCSEDDRTYITFSNKGTCQPEDNRGCVYQENKKECAGCLENCSGICDSFSCDTSPSVCQAYYCDPTQPATSLCQVRLAPEGTVCGMADGVSSGLCFAGDCVECLSDAECTNYPSVWSECFTAACIEHACVYQPKAGTAACGDRCHEGKNYGKDVGTCLLAKADDLSSMTCSSDQAVSCGGYNCTPDGNDCLVACGFERDCASTHTCQDSQCVEKETNP